MPRPRLPLPALWPGLASFAAGVALLGVEARWVVDAADRTGTAFAVEVWGRTWWHLSGAELPAAVGNGRLLLLLPSLAAAAAIGAGLAYAARRLGRVPLVLALAAAVAWLSVQPFVLTFVAGRSWPSAVSYLDVEDQARGLGVALVALPLAALAALARGARRDADAARGPARGEARSAVCAALVVVLVPAWLQHGVLEDGSLTNDEVAYRWQAQQLAESRLAAEPELPLAFFPARQIAVRDGRVFAKYPPGHSAALAVGERLGYAALLPRLLAALAVLATWRLARRLELARPDWAAWALALSPMVLGVESLWLSHATSLPCAALFGWGAVVAWDRAREGRGALLPAVLAGLALGALGLARPITAAAVGLPFLVQLLRLRPRGAWTLAGGVAAGVLPAALALLLVDRALTGDALLTAYQLYAREVSPNDRWGLVNLPTALPFTAFNLGRLATWAHGAGLALMLPALGLVLARPARHALLTFGVPLSLLGFYALHRFHGVPWVGPLYLVEGLPFLALLSAQGLFVVARAFGRPAAGVLVLACVLGSARLLAGHLEAARAELALRGLPYAAAERAGVRAGVVFVRLDDEESIKRLPLPPPRRGAELVFARDLGPRNAELLRALGGPPAWRYLPARDELAPLAP